MRTYIQKLGKSLMGPLSIIVASGLLLGIVSILQNEAIVGNTFSNLVVVNNFIGGVQTVVSAMFAMLPILFSISVAIGMSREDKETAAFSVVIAFILFNIVIGYCLSLKGITAETTTINYLMGNGYSEVKAVEISNMYDTVLGIFTYRMGIFGGIIVGLWTAMIHNKYHTQKLPTALGFFAGNRFVPIMIVITIPFLSILSFYIWPFFNIMINGLGRIISTSGIFGPFMYGFSERLLIPTGLHHVLNQLIRFTPIGGTANINGENISGALTIFNAEMTLQHKDMTILRDATKFLTQGTYPFMVFGLPAACYAMYKTSYLVNRPKVKGMLIASAATAIITGITEPIEFAFIFISPILWLFHAFMAGLSFMIMNMLGVAVGNAGGGLIDLTIFGILQGTYTRWYFCVILGIIYAVIYYFVFKYIIEKKNIKTPGRSNEIEIDEGVESSELGKTILAAIGGTDNINEIDNCISRLRLILKDTSNIDEKKIKATGALGIVKIDEHNLQIVYGGKVEEATRALKNEIKI